MFNVNREICIACKLCIKDCPARCIDLVEGKAEIDNSKCIKCCHCLAICPTEAISSDDYNMEEVIPYNQETFEINANQLLNFIKFRRSTRQFRKKEVEIEKLKQIIEAGRFTQTSRNSQDVSYIVVTDQINKLKELTLEGLAHTGQYMLDHLTEETKQFERYARLWIAMYDAYQQDPNSEDRVYFNAPALILVVSPNPTNAALASTNMELMTNALGLGTFYSGFTIRALQNNDKMRQFLGLTEDQQVVSCMVIGYPKIKYLRTVGRKEPQIKWM